jgi:hypothetical protein
LSRQNWQDLRRPPPPPLVLSRRRDGRLRCFATVLKDLA